MKACLVLTILACVLAACAADQGATRVPARLTITTASLPQGIVGAPYTAQLAGTGGDNPYTWAAIGLPAGLSISATGAISGMPTAAGATSVQFELTDAGPYTVTRTVQLDVVTPPPLNLTGNPPAAFTGMAYSYSLAASGGVQPCTFSVVSGALPTGLTLDTSTGAIAGTPTASGDWPFTAQATDLPGSTAQLACTIRVHEGVSVPFVTLPVAYDGQPYYARVDARGGLPPYQWAVGGAPAWMTAATMGDGWLELTGTPTGAGTLTLSPQATDTAGGIASTTLSLNIQTPPTATSGPSLVTTTALPRATLGEYFEQELHASGGIPVYWWSITGNLPQGLYIDIGAVSATARLRGRPQQAGVFTFHVDAAGAISSGTGQDIELVVECAIETMPDAAVGTSYDSQPTVNDGGAGLATTLDSATPHNGLAFTAVSASGTPAAQGRACANIRFSNSSGKEFNQLVGFDVRPQPAALAVVTNVLPDGRRGSGYAYSARLMAEGGSGQGFGWSVISGALPPGLALAGDTISGSATSDGTFNFTVQVTDSTAATATQALSVTIVAPVKGDFNGDGRADFVFGSYFFQSTGPGVCLYYAEQAQQRFGTIGTDDADFTVIGRTTSTKFGDLNGDGVADLVTAMEAATGQFTVGTVKIFYGSAQAPRFGVGAPDCTISTGVTGDEFGSAIAIGDMDADGIDDLVIGSRSANTGVALGGAVYIFYGGALQGQLGKNDADAQLQGQTPGAFNSYWGYYSSGYLGDSLLLHDLNADGRADLLAGATKDVYIHYATAARLGGTQVMGNVTDATLTGLIGSHLTERIAVGDYNGDGIRDIAVGGKDSYAFYGGTGAYPFWLDAYAGNAVYISTPNLQGHSLYVGMCTIDLNHDGVDDLVMNTPEQGLAYGFFGNATNPWQGALDWQSADVSYGFSLNAYAAWTATRCDYNGDGYDDLALGALNLSTATPNGQLYTAGATMILYGNPASPPSGSVSPIATAGVRFLGSSQNQGWGGCSCGG